MYTQIIKSAVAVMAVVPLFASAAMVNPPTMPQPGSGDIVGFILENPTGGTIAAAPTQMGQVFKAGDLPGISGVVAEVKGNNIPTQIDVKTKYPDGSVKFGVVTMLAPNEL